MIGKNIFLSWSGPVSREIGMVFSDWIPTVLHNANPYYTPRDIDKGISWASDISKNLQKCEVGIFFITKENQESQWMNFEAGAISKGEESSRVISILFGIEPNELKGPLKQYQNCEFSKEDILKLILVINKLLDITVKEDIVTKTFVNGWHELKRNIKPLLEKRDIKKQVEIPIRDYLEEILMISRFTKKTQDSLVNRFDKFSLDKNHLGGRNYEFNEQLKSDSNKAEQIEIISEHIRQGDFLLEKNPEMALIIYEKATDINSKHEYALIGIAKAYRRMEDLDKAIFILSGIIERNPKCERAYYNMSCYKNLSKKHSISQALKDLEFAIKLYPKYKEYARKDGDFSDIYDNPKFIGLTT